MHYFPHSFKSASRDVDTVLNYLLHSYYLCRYSRDTKRWQYGVEPMPWLISDHNLQI